MKYFLIFFLLEFSFSFSQISPEFDQVYQKITHDFITTDVEKALYLSDTLVSISKNNEEKVSSYMLKSVILRQMGQRNKGIETALIAEKISEESNLYYWNARVCGFLSTQYRENGIIFQGKKYLDKALLSIQKVNDKNQSIRFLGNMHQELAYYEMDDKKYEKAIHYLTIGNTIFNQLENEKDKNYYLAVNAELIGKNHAYNQRFDSAKYYYTKGIENLAVSSNPNSPLKGFIYNGLGNVYVAEKNLNTAYSYFTQALSVVESSQFMALKVEVYASLLNYYKLTGDKENYIAYNEKYLDLQNSQNEIKQVSANKIMEDINQKKQNAEEKQAVIMLVSLVILILIIISAVYAYKLKRKQDHKRFKSILKEVQLEAGTTDEAKVTMKQTETTYPDGKSAKKDYINKETEDKILEGLKRFEKSTKFLEKNISLSVLAGKLGTNTKYLSYVINQHKMKDFSSYINELRIYYIIQKLEHEPNYLNYKISYLAEECGFSSHSKFTTTFKNITGVSPSKFLEYLSQKEEKQVHNF